VKGSLKIMVQAYRALNMTDLEADSQKVYAANYPDSTQDVQAKKHWWQVF
jgi:outer membrane protein assembly factor BamD (BamD/ComL family)